MPLIDLHRLCLIALCTFAFARSLSAAERPAYENPQAGLDDRVETLFQAMTPDERLTLLAGSGDSTTNAVPRLKVPPMVMLDATQGAHGSNKATAGRATLFTSGVLMAASWDVDLAARIGDGVGVEAMNKGSGGQVLLGPGLNIMRSPLGGRNGEYIGGEDPHLMSRMAVAYIKGMQNSGIAACMKHFACNNQEFLRGIIDVNVDERTLREIYTPAYIAAAKEAKVWTVMAAYNRVNGAHCSTNWYLLQQILRNEAGFDGLVMTDWFSAGKVSQSNDGCDLEMPNSGYASPPLLHKAIDSGDLAQASVDESVRRILRTIIRVGLMDGPRRVDHAKINSPAHQKLALEAAEKGIVLLKNEKNVLPLNSETVRSIALIGPACKAWQMGLAGSAHVEPFQSTSAYDGIVARAGKGIKVLYNYGYDDHGGGEHFSGQLVPSAVLKSADGKENGLTGEFFEGYEFAGKPASTRVSSELKLNSGELRAAEIKDDHYCVRWSGTLTAPTSGAYRMNLEMDIEKSGGRLYIDDKLIQDVWPGFDGSNIGGAVDLVAGQTYKVRVEYVNISEKNSFQWTWLPPGEDLFKEAVETARQAGVAVVFVGTRPDDEAEFKDRRSMVLPGVQNDLIRAIGAANPNTIVVMNNGCPVLVSDWINQVPAAVEAFFPAQAGGEALAHILFGDVNPSGKLPYTIGKAREDYPDFSHYPVRPETFKFSRPAGDLANATVSKPVVDYAEGIYVGYRSFDKKQIEPSFAFGHGLSYTNFKYANAKLSKSSMAPTDTVTLTADVTNTGRRTGAEIVQLYARSDSPKIDRPIRELKGFARVDLQQGETKPVRFQVSARDFAYCDVPGKQWKADAGTYTLELGASSRDLLATAQVQLAADYTEALPGIGARSPFDPQSLTSGKPITASSSENGFPPENAVDGDSDSRWSSTWSDQQWLAVDLGSPTRFDHAQIVWEAACAKEYALQTSDDGKAWKTVYTNKEGKPGSEKIAFPAATARWIRILGIKRTGKFGYSVFAFNVYAPEK